MFKALIFKEWLKVRWTFISVAAVSMLVILYIFLDLSHALELSGSVSVWGFLIYMKAPLASDLVYLPFVAGLLVSIVQFYPEINSGRLKLTLHLPVKENRMLLQMIAIGGGLLLILFLVDFLLLSLFLASYFPSEFNHYTINNLLPTFIAGLITYFAVALIMVEPVWSRRIPQIIIWGALISLLIGSIEHTGKFLLFFLAAGSFSVTSIILSGFYFKRGIK